MKQQDKEVVMSNRWQFSAILLFLLISHSPTSTCIAAAEGATANSTQSVGPSQREIGLFGKRLENVSDISISPFTFQNLVFLANQYSLGGQPTEAERIAHLGLEFAKANDPSKILTNAMTQSLIGSMVSLEDYDSAERLLLDRLADSKVPSLSNPNTPAANHALEEIISNADIAEMLDHTAKVQHANDLLLLSGVYESEGLYQRASNAAEAARAYVEKELLPPLIADGRLYRDTATEDQEFDRAFADDSAEWIALLKKTNRSDADEKGAQELSKSIAQRAPAFTRRVFVNNVRELHTLAYYTSARIMLASNRLRDAAQDLDRMLDLRRRYHLAVDAGHLTARARMANALGETEIAASNFRAAHLPAKAGVGARDLAEPLQYPLDQTVIENALGPSRDSLIIANSDMTLGDVYVGLGRYDEALPLFDLANSTIEHVLGRQSYMYADEQRRIAQATALKGDKEGALARTREATATFSQLDARRNSESTGRMNTYGGPISNYATHLTLLGEQAHDGHLTDPVADEVLMVMQAAIVSQAGRSILSRNLRWSDPEMGPLLRAVQDSEREVTLARGNLINGIAVAPNAADAIRLLQASLRRSEDRLAKTRLALKLRYPKAASLLHPEPITLAEVRHQLGSADALMIFMVADNQCFGLVVTGDDAVISKVSLGRQALYDQVQSVRASIDLTALERDGRLPNFDFETASRLYKSLVSPLLDRLKVKVAHLYIVPAAPLDSIPFAILVKENPDTATFFEKYAKADWLVNAYSTTTLPIVADIMSAGNDQRWTGPVTAAAFADPSGLPETFESVASTREEITKIYSLLNIPLQTAYFGSKATEGRLRSLDLESYDMLIFATHAVTADEAVVAKEPALILSRPHSVTSSTDDGYLTASEIATLKTSAKLVILSACSTAASDGSLGAESLSGIANSLFLSGAKTLLVSHWAVDSHEASQIVVGTVSSMRSGHTSDEALRLTTLGILAKPRFALERHPAYWGPFVFVGR
jgi:CHAT domain-containing protein